MHPKNDIDMTSSDSEDDVPRVPHTPDLVSKTAHVRNWIQQWHRAHHITINAETLSKITWDGRYIHSTTATQLECDLLAWGFDSGRARVLVADLLPTRKQEIVRGRLNRTLDVAC
jgi:hypothetical protein